MRERTIPTGMSAFARMRRRAAWQAAAISLTIHLGAGWLAGWTFPPAVLSSHVWNAEDFGDSDAASADGGALEVVPVPEAPPATPGAPPGLSPRLFQRRLGEKVGEAIEQDPAALLERLAALAAPAEAISDNSLDEIALFLGKQPGRYEVRSYYRDELNPNFNLAAAAVVRASAFADANGDPGYTITLRDAEEDGFTFTLRGAGAERLAGADFALRGARVTDLKRRSGGGCLLALRGARGQTMDLPIPPAQAGPFLRERIRFARNARGERLYADRGETLHGGAFDHESAAIYDVSPITDEDGKEGYRVTLLDAHGERFIFCAFGDAAEPYRPLAKALSQSSAVGRILRAVVAPLTPQLRHQAQGARRRETPRPAEAEEEPAE